MAARKVTNNWKEVDGKVVIQASAKHTATFVFLHGLGDTGVSWANALAQIKPSYVKLICPSAPVEPVTLYAGFRVSSWFDIQSLDISKPEDQTGIQKAATNVHQLIEEEEKAGIPSHRIILGGFSQGGALALFSAFGYKKPLGGVIALSCWLPLRHLFPAAAAGNRQTQILQCHGNIDPVVPLMWGEECFKIMKQFAPNSAFKTYKGLSHASSEEELFDIKNFLEKVLLQLPNCY